APFLFGLLQHFLCYRRKGLAPATLQRQRMPVDSYIPPAHTSVHRGSTPRKTRYTAASDRPDRSKRKDRLRSKSASMEMVFPCNSFSYFVLVFDKTIHTIIAVFRRFFKNKPWRL